MLGRWRSAATRSLSSSAKSWKALTLFILCSVATFVFFKKVSLMGCMSSSDGCQTSAHAVDESYHGSGTSISTTANAYNFVKITMPNPGPNIFRLAWGSDLVTFEGAVEKLASGELGDILTRTIVQEADLQGWKAVFWECRPAQSSDIGSIPFEFVVLDAPTLASVTAEPNTFKAQFDAEENAAKLVVDFDNLGKDAHLVSPKPALHPYPHLLAFLQTSSKDERDALWITVGKAYLSQVQAAAGARRWLSTSGMGVYWLHVRIDNTPKYYHYDAFKHVTAHSHTASQI